MTRLIAVILFVLAAADAQWGTPATPVHWEVLACLGLAFFAVDYKEWRSSYGPRPRA